MFKCEKSTIRVNGKVNFIALGIILNNYIDIVSNVSVVDSCKKVAVAFDSVVSSLEVLNCQSVQAQVYSIIVV